MRARTSPRVPNSRSPALGGARLRAQAGAFPGMKTRTSGYAWGRASSLLPLGSAACGVPPVQKSLLASGAAVSLPHAADNPLNNYFDFLSGIDRKIDRDESRPGRLRVRGALSPREVLAMGAASLMLAAPLSQAIGMHAARVSYLLLVWASGLGIGVTGGAGVVPRILVASRLMLLHARRLLSGGWCATTSTFRQLASSQRCSYFS